MKERSRNTHTHTRREPGSDSGKCRESLNAGVGGRVTFNGKRPEAEKRENGGHFGIEWLGIGLVLAVSVL